MQVIIIRDPAHGEAEEQNAREPADGAARPNPLLFHNAGGETHATPSQSQDTTELDVPRHQIEMAFSPDFAPQTDNGDQRDEEFNSIGQAQPGWIQRRRDERRSIQQGAGLTRNRRTLRAAFRYFARIHFTSQRIMFSFPSRYFSAHFFCSKCNP